MDFDLHEHTCIECKNVFYTKWLPLPKELTKPSFCPFCGVEFTYTFKTKEQVR